MSRISDECAQFRTSNVIASKAKQSTIWGKQESLIATLALLARNDIGIVYDSVYFWRCGFNRTHQIIISATEVAPPL
ncbi:MAG: hypothetical protein K2N54_09010 [Helicobacter sp.]|nr:hypothetical protein [Helicobacter sp.]